MDYLGYEFLRRNLELSAFPLLRPAVIGAVSRVEDTGGLLLVPKTVAPQSADPLVHVLFALKHEGTNLQVLAETMPRIEASDLLRELHKAPTSAYTRTACYLWEYFAKKTLADIPAISGPTAELFDPVRYVTGPLRRNSKWRVAFNGLGSMDYCVTVERTSYLQEAIKSDVLARTRDFVGTLGRAMTDRALAWAYLHETESSFAIERESPNESKSQLFISLLRQAHERREISEGYLVELQNSVVNNKFDKASGFRSEQNWLRGALRGAAGITYLPPPPDLVPDLMKELISFANNPPREIDPVIIASVVSFGFVYVHPFMDGNGRLSRFLFHQALCQSGRLDNGMLLPVSIAMKRNESDYLSALREYSQPSRQQWSARWVDGEQYDFRFNGKASSYRYWNATKQVEFGYRMAEQALEIELKNETEFLARYDHIVRSIDRDFDVRGNLLSTLTIMCLDNDNKISNHRRKQFFGQVPEDVFDAIEKAAGESANPPPTSGTVRQKTR